MPSMFPPTGPRMTQLEVHVCDTQKNTLFFCGFDGWFCRWPKTDAANDEYIKLELRTTPVEGPPNSYRSEEVCFTDVLNRKIYGKKFDKAGARYRWRSSDGVEVDGKNEDGTWMHELESYKDSAFWGPLKYCHGPVGNRDALNFPFTELSFRFHAQRWFESYPSFNNDLDVCGVKVTFGKPGQPGFSRWSWKGRLSIIEEAKDRNDHWGFGETGKGWYWSNGSSYLYPMRREDRGRIYF